MTRPTRAGDFATTLLVPTTVPTVHEETVATPCSSVTCVPPATDPPPLVTAKEMLTPGTPAPDASTTRTEGRSAVASPAATSAVPLQP